MQTGIEAHNTDQEQGNVMNNNPNCGRSRREKQMNTATRRVTQPRKHLSAMKTLHPHSFPSDGSQGIPKEVWEIIGSCGAAPRRGGQS
jgi:hypothetical protein